VSDENPAAFSLELGDDLVEMRDWLHGFAESVIRPAAAEWDEREETPWPVLEEAAKVGLYSLDFYGQQYLEGSGLGIPVAFEELFWGDAGIGLSLAGSSLAAVAVVANGTPEQIGEWCPQMFGGPGDVKLGAFCSSEPEAGSDVSAIKTRAVYDAAADEWVLNGVKTWVTNGGIANVHVVVASVDPDSGRAGRRASSCRPARPAFPWARSSEHGIRPRTPPRSSCPTSACPAGAWSAAGSGSRSGWPGSARAAAAASRPP
jgi:Acyl-CoA dehydrogenases